MFQLTCAQCGNELAIPDRFAGQAGRCRHCQAPIAVPAPLCCMPGDLQVVAATREWTHTVHSRRVDNTRPYMVGQWEGETYAHYGSTECSETHRLERMYEDDAGREAAGLPRPPQGCAMYVCRDDSCSWVVGGPPPTNRYWVREEPLRCPRCARRMWAGPVCIRIVAVPGTGLPPRYVYDTHPWSHPASWLYVCESPQCDSCVEWVRDTAGRAASS